MDRDFTPKEVMERYSDRALNRWANEFMRDYDIPKEERPTLKGITVKQLRWLAMLRSQFETYLMENGISTSSTLYDDVVERFTVRMVNYFVTPRIKS